MAKVEEYHALQLTNGYLTNDTQSTAIVDGFDFSFIPFVNPDTSTNPCAEGHKGLAATDTPKITSLVSFTKPIDTNDIKLYIDFHSYGQYILQPYGYSCYLYPANINQQLSAANQMANRISAYSGALHDWI